MINKVTILGRVGRDPEIRTLQNGNKKATLSLATSERWKDKNTGEKREKTDWHNVVIWNEGLIGVLERFVKKGDLLHVEGKLETRKWQDQSGQDRYSTEIVLKPFRGELTLIPTGNRGDGNRSDHDQDDGLRGGGRSAGAASHSGKQQPDYDDEIPF